MDISHSGSSFLSDLEASMHTESFGSANTTLFDYLVESHRRLSHSEVGSFSPNIVMRTGVFQQLDQIWHFVQLFRSGGSYSDRPEAEHPYRDATRLEADIGLHGGGFPGETRVFPAFETHPNQPGQIRVSDVFATVDLGRAETQTAVAIIESDPTVHFRPYCTLNTCLHDSTWFRFGKCVYFISF